MSDVRAGVYRHYKGQYYLVLGVSRHSETEEVCVVYVPLYVREGARMCHRPIDGPEGFFTPVVERNWAGIEFTTERFAYVGTEMPEVTS